jgi:cytochrome c553
MKHILFIPVLLVLLAACSKEPEPNAVTYNIEAGKVIAESKCIDCHKMDGRGKTADTPNLAAQPVGYLTDAMRAYRDGGRLHAALQDMTQGMSDEDIVNIAGYYASLPKLEPIEPVRDSLSSYAEGESASAMCEECHGEKGISTTEGMPSLAGQQPAYLIVATQEYKDGTRINEDKSEMLAELEQIDIEKIAMYFASQSAPARDRPPFGDPSVGKAESAKCGKCHGARGISHDPLVPSLAGQEPVYLVNAIRAYRNHERFSEEPMPEKSDQQIENLAAFYSVQKSEAAVESQLSGQQIAAKCDRCHNPAAGNRKLNVPALSGQSHEYLVKAMKEYRREDRENSMMHKMSARFSDEMIEAVASYYASQ